MLTQTLVVMLMAAAPAATDPSAAAPPVSTAPAKASAPKADKAKPDKANKPAAAEKPAAEHSTTDANRLHLYTDGYAASYLPVPGFKGVDVPVRDATDGAAGCYIACSAHERRGSIYAPDPNTFVVGAVRIMGSYQGGVCYPGGQEHIDLASDTRLAELCALAMPKICDNRRCFAIGDTATWLPPSEIVGASVGSPAAPPQGEESCVLACYSHSGDGALYQVASDVFAVGGFQTGGRYVESICKPQNFEGDLGADPGFKHRCTELFPKQCANDICWPNGDTRGRLGGR